MIDGLHYQNDVIPHSEHEEMSQQTAFKKMLFKKSKVLCFNSSVDLGKIKTQIHRK